MNSSRDSGRSMMIWACCRNAKFPLYYYARRKKKFAGVLATLLVFSLWGSFARAANLDYFVEVQSPDQGRRAYLGYMDDPHLKRCQEDLMKGEKWFKYALSEVTYVLDRFPNHPRGLKFMELVARMLRNPQLAIARYQRALNIFPQYAYTHGQYGLFLINLGQVRAGISRLNEAVQMEPKNMNIYKMLARAYTKTGNLGKAREALEAGKRATSQSTIAGPNSSGEEENLVGDGLETTKEQPQDLPLKSGDEEGSSQ